MASNINGIGTTYISSVFDEADLRPRTATEWFIILELPILPLRRAVLDPISHRSQPRSERTDFHVVQRRWLNPMEVLFVYLWRWCVVAPAALTGLCTPGFLIVLLMMSAGSSGIGDVLPNWLVGVLGLGAVLIAVFGGIFVAAMACLLLRRIECAVLSLFDDGPAVAARLEAAL